VRESVGGKKGTTIKISAVKTLFLYQLDPKMNKIKKKWSVLFYLTIAIH
jgi:hypothetical protein